MLLYSGMKTFNIKVVREAGTGPLGDYLEAASEEFQVEAKNEQEAYKQSMLLCSLKFRGQLRRTFINGVEHFDARF